jgi:hypothetical protein
MNLQEYFEFTETTKSYPNLVEYDYLTHGIWAEIGEFEGILAKRLRGDEKYKDDDYYFCSLKSELGDIYWFLVRILYLKKYYSLDPTVGRDICFSNIPIQISILKNQIMQEEWINSLLTLSKICYLLEVTWDEILALNVKKLTERKQTNTIKGNGETVNERYGLGSK